MHDLLRLYARQLGDQASDPDAREQARDRLLRYYRYMAEAADQHIRAPFGAGAPDTFTGRADAPAWLDAERPSLVGAVTLAAGTGQDEIAARLALCLGGYFDLRWQVDDRLATITIARKAVRRLGDRRNEATILTNLGHALAAVRRFDEAITAYRDAAAIRRETGERHGEAETLNDLGIALAGIRRFDEAITAFRDAAVIFRETGDRHRAGIALNNLRPARQK